MEFEWDEDKRSRILEDRALDFASAYRFFDGRLAIHQPSPRNRGAVENDGGDRRRVLYRRLNLAWREHPRDLNEASA